uniref:Nesprin-1-like n=1 Tax=Sinocyclocheilus grahami TaxID=75366 RepID=A0A672NJW8_SINGR
MARKRNLQFYNAVSFYNFSHQERRDDLLKQSLLRQSLQQQTKTLCDVCEPAEVQQLQGRWESSLQPYMEAHQLVELRGESLEKLEAFLHTHSVAAGVLQGLRQTVESAGSWDKSRVDELQKDLEAVVPDISRLETLAVNLDSSLCKAHLHLMNGKVTRSSCRSLADSLSVELDAVRNLLGSKQSEAEALGALWSSFRQRKEQLLKTVEDIEEKADKQGLKEPSVLTLQQRLRLFNQLEDELQSHQHEEQWLRDKGQQLAHRDAELGGEVLREINFLQTTWEDTKKLIAERQEQSSTLVELMKDYQSLKASINTILESADAISDIKAHEAIKAEMASNQDVLERFSSKGKKLLSELNKIPDCDTQIVKTEIDATVDQWLDVSEKIEDNLESLKRSSALWVEIYDISGEIESWSNSSVMDLTDGLNNFNDSQKSANKLSEVEKIDALQEKVSELKRLCGGQDAPAKLQVMETDLRRKISNIEELCDQAKGNLQDFCSQKKQLEDFLSQMSEWLKNVERSLVDSPCGTAPEEICRVKVQKNQQTSIDSARESLNTLCRKYPSEELAGLGSFLTDLIKKYETVNQLCVKKLGSMQHGLQQHFNDLVKEFHTWLSGQKDIVRECADHSGDMSVVERKLQKLKGALERVDDGDSRLTLVCTEGEKLLLHLPKASAGQVQQNLSSIQQDWDSYVEQCKQNQQNLEESASLLSGFESRLQRLTRWLEHMDVRMSTELPEGRHSDHERVTLERVEEFQHEVLKERDSFESLCQEAQSLSEGGHGSGAELRVSAQLQLQHQALLKAARERLRICQLSLQEQQNFEETLQSTWGWLSGVQERLNSLNSTSGNRETLEKRLGLVQDILLMKGEGEVKLNMTVGKGEQVLKNCSRDKQEVIRSQLKSLKDSWANILMTAMSCHSRLEWTVAQWGSFLESKAQLQQWMEMVEQEAGVALPQQPGLKEKASLLERLRAIQADVEVHSSALTRLNEKATELYEKTGDQAFAEGPKSEFNTQFTNITAVIKEIVKEHEQYMESVRELNDWLTSAKEELQRWSDMSGDAASVQRKLSKVRGLLDSRKQGHERLTRVQSCGAATRDHTSTVGCEVLEREEAGLLSAWEQWERGAKHMCSGLEGVLAQMASSEQEFNSLAAQLEQDLQEFSGKLQEWRIKLEQGEEISSGEEAVQGWQIAKDALEALLNIEPMSDNLKCLLNDLCRFSRDLGAQSERVSALIKEYNSLSLQASRECQGKEKLLEQRFRAAFRDFQQWLVNAKISTAKCFDVPQNLAEASSSLQKIQEFLSDREQGHGKLNTVAASGELLMSIAPKDRVESIRAKSNTAREDWKSLMTNLHQRETALQNLQAQMRDFETSVEPLQDWLNETEEAVQESSSRLHDLTAKKQELHRLQSLLEELASKESQLHRLRVKAQQLWDGHTAGKGFVHRVSQLSAQYLALSNLTKEKASRIDRIVSEHQLFSQGLKELQNWVADTSHMLQTYCTPTADKNVLDSRMIKLEALLTARQEKEIQLKMLVTRGESVQRNTSAEGVPLVRQQIEDLKDSWDGLLSASIQCKSQLEGALSQWTSYQEDVHQFVSWMEMVEETLNSADKQCSEMRDKTTNLGKAKVLCYCQYFSNCILEVCAVAKAEELVSAHQEYQRTLHEFKDWLEQQQERLSCSYTQLEGDVETLEDTLRKLQELQVHCTEGQALLNTLLVTREQVIPWGVPQLEDRCLEMVQQEWGSYQVRLGETRSQLNSALAKLRQIEQKFQRLDNWLKGMETKGELRSGRRSDRATKEAQLQLLKGWHEEVLAYQEEIEGLSVLAQQVLEETPISSRVSTRATQLTSRYHALLLHLLDTIKQLKEEVSCIEESQSVFSTFSDWLSTAEKNFSIVATTTIDVVDRVAMEKKMKKLEALQGDMELGHTFLKTMREKTDRAMTFLEEPEAEQLKEEVDTRLCQLETLIRALRSELSATEKSIQLSKDFLDKYKTQTQWLTETKSLLASPVEPKAELYQKKAQLAKYKVRKTLLFLSAVKSVIEKGDALLKTIRDPSISEDISKLKADYQELCNDAKVHVQSLTESVREHEVYNSELQEVEKWLLQMSSRLVTSDSMQSGNLETATQQLARHKAIMEEIAGFEERLTSLKDKGDLLTSSCTEQVQTKISQQIQAHQQGTRDSYSAICSTAQRVYQSLDRELQKHVSHQDTLQQCQTWLSTVKEEIQLQAQTPYGLQEALKQVKHFRALQEQASTYLDLVCSVCDLSDEPVRTTAAKIQQTKMMIEERMTTSQELSNSWREIKEQKQELATLFQDMEQQLQSLSRRPAELEPKIAQNMLDQANQLQSRQSTLTKMTELVSKLTEGQESPEHTEIGRLSHAWLELCHQANKLQAQREEDLQRTKEYHDCISAMEALFEQVSKEWDNLARTDAESSSDHLEALRKLSVVLKEKKSTLEDLKEQKQKVMYHLNLDDKELVKEQIGHFEQRWAHLESLIERKIQDSIVTLEDMGQVEARLREACEWAEEQQPALSEAMKMSPPPELAQSFLFDHLSICSELEAKQLLLAQAMSDADRVLAHLGLNERQRLQQLISETQAEVESLSIKVAQRRKHLSKAFTERTQFLLAVNQAITWVQQNEKKAQAEEYIALLPDDLSKQVRTCRNIQSSLRAYQSELTSLWSQGRDLMKDAAEEEKSEMLNKLQELQNIFEVALQKCSQRLQELEKVLVTRKYFKVDLEKICQWLKQADIVTFPEINLMNGDAELISQLTKYQQILDQAMEYENLLLTVQRTGQEILPTLNEVDHCYLDEKLIALPQQYNNILGLAKEKQEKIQQAILARQEYASFIDVTHKALKELEEQFHNLGTQSVGLKTEEVVSLLADYKALLEELTNLGQAVSELNQKKEGFRSTGQPWRPEEMAQLVSLYNGLKRLIEQRVEHLDDTLESFEDHQAMAMQVDSELKATKEQLVKVNAETQSAEERLKNYHALAASLQGASSHLTRLMEQMDNLAPHMDSAAHEASKQRVTSWQEELQSLQSAVGELIVECENRFVQSKDFETEVNRTLTWLQQIKDELGSEVVVDVKVEKVQEEIRKQQIMQEEVQSRLRIVAALSTREKQKYTSANELVPPHVDSSLQEMAKLEADVQRALSSKQKYHSRMQTACEWLEDAVGFLQQASLGVDVENYEECLRQQEDIMATEQEFLGVLEELESLPPQLENLVNPTAKEQLQLSVKSAQQRGVEVRDQLQCHQDILNSCVAQWNSYQEARQTVIELMNEAEKKLTEFSTAKAATNQEAEEKLRISMVNSFQEKLTGLEEQASQLELIGSDASKATISRSMTTVWQRWTRLRSVARGQERVLEDTAHEWRTFREKMMKVRAVTEELKGRVPDCTAEKASKATLQSNLDQYELVSQDLERELSSLTLLRQYALSLLHGVEVSVPAADHEKLPCLREVKAVQDQLESLLQKARTGKTRVQQELSDREGVERGLSLVKSWIQDSRELLLNPTSDLDILTQELEVMHGELITHRQNVDKLAEQQQSKYLDLYTILPSEISMQLAEVSLALGSIEDQVQAKERDIQKTRVIKEEFNSRIHDVSEKLKAVSTSLKEKATDIDQAKDEARHLCDELDGCGRNLAELEAAVQDFGRRNPLIARQLADAIAKLREIHHHTLRLAEYKTIWLKKADAHLDEYSEMFEFIVKWTDRARSLVKANIIWNSSSHLQEQIRMYQSVLRESRELHGDLRAMQEKVEILSETLQVEAMGQQVSELSRHTEELEQSIRLRLQSLQDAAKDMERFETEVKSLHVSLEQVQATLTSPELSRLSLKEQLTQRQRLLADMECFKQQVEAVQDCQSALRVPEEVVTSLSICRTALNLQQEASQLQHTAIQQCNILQEAVVQYEQYEQEVKNLQAMIEDAHRVIQYQPVNTSNIQELQTQINHHEELAQKIKGYQEQIASLNSKCKMLTVKAKHATTLLTVSDAEGLTESLEELDGDAIKRNTQSQMSASRCQSLLSPVTEESGEEGTSSEICSPAFCRSPSPITNPEAAISKVLAGMSKVTYSTLNFNLNQYMLSLATLTRAPIQELYNPALESVASLDDLQRSWETLKSVISEKQKTLYEALEKQQRYQGSLQSISTKMESIETRLNEPPMHDLSPDRQMVLHQNQMEEIVKLQNDIDDLQSSFTEELISDAVDSDSADQLAMQSTLTVLTERMTTIHMKASGKRQLLEERQSERVEKQQEAQALQRYLNQADQLDQWLQSIRGNITSCSQDSDMEEQLRDCQNMLLEIEEKVLALSELSRHSENLLLEGRPENREDAEQLARKLRTLKGSLLELQRMLQDKQINIQDSLKEPSDSSESDSSLSQSPNMQDWLAQARSTRSLQHQDTLQKQKELEEQLAEQKKLLKSVASRGEEILTQQASPVRNTLFSGPALLTENAETQLSNHETLGKEVTEVTRQVSHSEGLIGGSVGLSEEEQMLMKDTLDCLTRRLGALDSALDRRCDTMRSRMRELTAFQTELHHLFTALSESKFQIIQKVAGVLDHTTTKQIETIAEAEEMLKDFEHRITELKARGAELQPDQFSTNELLKLQDAYEELVMTVGSRRSGLNQNMSLKNQYERVLQDLIDLVDTAQDKMNADQKMIASSVEDVHNLLDKHKEFFQGLEWHMVLTETFYKKISAFVLPRERQTLEETLARAQDVLKQAHKKGVELECISETWSRLVSDYQNLYRLLEDVEGSLPSIGLVEESEERLNERIDNLPIWALKASLTEHQHKLHQVLEEGKHLLSCVSCSSLENQLTLLGEHWLNNSTKINKELQNLESILKHSTRYKRESVELSRWLQEALERLDFWNTQFVAGPQELETVKDQLSAFLEFSKEVETRSSLKASVLNEGNQLLRLKKMDTASLRSELARLDSQWSELLARIPVVQEKLHQSQMDKLASRHAIAELVNWISLMERVIEKDEENLKGAVGSKVIQEYLQRYKGFRVDVNCKQLTVDFVNQSVLQISGADVESKRSDKTDFAEKLGAMNCHWQILQTRITERVRLQLQHTFQTLFRLLVDNFILLWVTMLGQMSFHLMEWKCVCFVVFRWNSLQEEIVERLKSSKALLQLWQSYKDLYGQSDSSIQTLEERANQMLKTASHKDITEEEVSTWIQDCASLQVLLELGEQLKQQVDTSAAASIQSDHLSLTQRLSAVEQSLSRQQVALQVIRDYETFNEQLDSLSRWIVEAEEILKGQDPNGSSDQSLIQDRMEELKKQMLKFSSMAPDLERLNELGYRLPLNDSEIKRLQNLNRSCSTTSAQTTERFSKLQALLLQQQTFLEKCETWMEFLVQTEEKLTVEISGNFQSLMEQQRAHELFQAEMFSRQQILHSIISDGQRMLEQGQVDDRDEFKLKLALLSNQWQGVVRRAQQRRGIIDSLLRQWQRYRKMVEKLRKWLVEVSHQAETLLAGTPVPLQQARAMLDAVQLREKVLLRQQGSYILTVEAGRQLLLSADTRAEAALQEELLDIQERWRHANIRLEEQKKELAVLLRDWERCEKGIGGSLEKLRAFKRQLSQPLPDRHEELQSEQMRCKDLESMFDGWKEDLTHLTVLRESLSSYISPEDLRVLQERIELLHRQWEEICHQLCLRRQQVSEKLNEWAIFNDKYKELCEWLTQMESKVSQNGDISIEEMIEKLRKDYQEEVAVVQENKHELQQLGERLARASHESKASDIEHKLSKVNERWQHLLDLIGARVKKLRETLVAVQQLDKNMNSLRSWLAHIETELSRPIVYDTCDYQEIQRKLDLQQELQRDIEKHSTGVASVLNLCEVLLHDCDACATDAECDSIQQATRSLDRRWRSICAMSMERRLRIEETWRLWQKFLDDFSHFEEWLMLSEKTAALPNSSGVLYTVAKEELKKFETFQRQVHESLTQLELINKQYQRLARENRTDAACSLREMAHNANQRWDNLQRRVSSVLRRLKHFISQREEFETARDCILVWLTEMDLQLTNIEHFSECDVQAKIKQLRAFQQEITLNTAKIDHIFQQGEALLEKSEPIDAAVIEEELEELQRYCQEVFGRVERYYKKLIRLPLTDDEHDVSYSDREFDLDEPADVSSFPWSERLGDGFLSPLPSSSRSASLAVPLRAERSGRDTPASVDSIPLEWDHDYDLSRGLESTSRALSSEPGDQGEDGYLQSSASALSDVVIPESPEAYLKLTEHTLRSSAGRHQRQLDKALNTSCFHLQQTENIIRSRTPTGPELDATYMGYMRLLEECRGSIDAVKRVGFELKEEDDKVSGFVNPNSSESQTSGVIERWELLQAQALSKEMRMKQNMQQWQQFNSDLNSICSWLDQAEEELEQQRGLDLSTDIQTIELRIKKLKELQKALDKRKAIVLSINLCSAEFVQSDSEEARDLQRRLKEMNNRWERLSSSLDEWRNALQHVLMQCQDFHEMSHGLLLWLENIDRRRNEIVPIDHTQDSDTLQEHHKTLLQIRRELLDTQLKVASLQDMSLQLLVHSEGSDCLEAKEKVHVIGNRLKLLLKEVTRDIRELQKTLDISSSQQDLSSWSSADELDTSGSLSPVSGRSTPSLAHLNVSTSLCRLMCSRSRNAAGSGSSHSDEEEPPSWCKTFLKRVLWAALPLQIILLLVVVVACLVPTSEDDYSCAQLNNFARSFHPMLSYINGPPPI